MPNLKSRYTTKYLLFGKNISRDTFFGEEEFQLWVKQHNCPSWAVVTKLKSKETDKKERIENMKNFKKIFAILLAAIMMMAMGITTFAATVDVKDVIDGETYTAYKILNYTANENKSAVSYYLNANEYDSGLGSALVGAGFSFTKSSDGTQYVLNNASTVDVADAAAKLAQNVSIAELALGTFTTEGANKKAVFEGLSVGYYFITTSAGSLCALHDENEIETVVEKNTVTTEDKKQGSTEGIYDNAQLDMNIGDTVYYDVDIMVGKGANYDVTLTDTMSDGLDLNQNGISIKVGGIAVATENYTLNTSAHSFTLTFDNAYIATLAENTVIKVEYSAVINENALIRDLNTNTAKLNYSNQEFTDSTGVKTYDILIKKTDENNNFLNGAGFKLYDAEEGGNQITVAKDNTGYYVDKDSDEEIMIDSADGVNVRGLAPGTYYLEETTVPDGYNKLDKREPVNVIKDSTVSEPITVINKAGSVLPSTGGMGTTIFYVVGAILVIGAGVILVSKRRMSNR